MAYDKNGLLALVATNKPDNSTGAITPAKDRQVNEEMIASAANLLEETEQTFSGDIKFLGKGLGYYVEEARFSSNVSQTSAGIDARNVITLGAASTSVNSIVSVDAAGIVTVLKSGPIFFRQSAKLSRTNTSGQTEIFFQAQYSIDDGVTWIATGETRNERLDNNKSISVFMEMSPVFLTAGMKFRLSWAESSAGGNPSAPTTGVTGTRLLYSEPSASLLTEGFSSSPSAEVTFYRLADYNYE